MEGGFLFQNSLIPVFPGFFSTTCHQYRAVVHDADSGHDLNLSTFIESIESLPYGIHELEKLAFCF